MYQSNVKKLTITKEKPLRVIWKHQLLAVRSCLHRVGIQHSVCRNVSSVRISAGSYSRHAHRKTFYHKIGVEGLEHIFRYQGIVHGGVFVLVELLQVPLPYVDHYEAENEVPRGATNNIRERLEVRKECKRKSKSGSSRGGMVFSLSKFGQQPRSGPATSNRRHSAIVSSIDHDCMREISRTRNLNNQFTDLYRRKRVSFYSVLCVSLVAALVVIKSLSIAPCKNQTDPTI